MVTIYIVKS